MIANPHPMRPPIKTIRCMILSTLFVAAFAPCLLFAGGRGDLHIAVVCPLSGRNASNGKAVIQGVRLYVDAVNRGGGVDGQKIVLDVYDDEDDADTAAKMARDIAGADRALAVIGHESSTCSIMGGEVYLQHRIPAISPTSTDVRVTRRNPWYFRMTFNNEFQGRFLANYMRKVFRQGHVSVIHEDLAYGANLAKVFVGAASNLGMTVPYVWRYDVKDKGLDQRLEEIVDELDRAGEKAGAVFIALHPPEGFKLITLLRDRGIENRIVFAAGLSSPKFLQLFSRYPKEMEHPGYYTDGMYAASGVIFDTADEKDQAFMEAYRRAYGEEPNRRAAFSYDAAKVVHRALLEAGISGDLEELAVDRHRIRQWLASRDSSFKAISGVTGRTYFNADGDPSKPITMGMFKNRRLVSAPVQLQEVPSLSEIPNVREALAQERVIRVGGRYFYKTNVVYTGVQINKISEIDIRSQTYLADVYIWFRYHGNIEPQEIEFLYAAEPVTMGTLVSEKRTERMTYRKYKATGRFMMDSYSDRRMYGEHVLNIGFRHRTMPRCNLVYVTDLLGMEPPETLRTKMETSRVLGPSEDWAVSGIYFSQGVSKKESLGHPDHLESQSGVVDYSKFKIGVRIKKRELRLRRNLPPAAVNYLFGGSVIVLLCGFLPGIKRESFLLIKAATVAILLVSTEVMLLQWFLERHQTHHLQPVIRMFDILWWGVPAFFLIRCIERYIWTPLEQKTNRSIPNLVRRFVKIFIWMLVCFGILAFVFDRKITSLLATSGVITMIIGLAIQVNIANIFSGIAINLERPFQIGDWIKINDLGEGKVSDITWRTTRIWTSDNNMVNIPNSMASEAVIVNYNRPDEAFKIDIDVHLDVVHPPEQVEDILREAMLSVTGVRRAEVLFRFHEWGCIYTGSVFVRDYGQIQGFQHAVTKKIWMALTRAGIEPVGLRYAPWVGQEPSSES